jgi:hypothetical protein
MRLLLYYGEFCGSERHGRKDLLVFAGKELPFITQQ